MDPIKTPDQYKDYVRERADLENSVQSTKLWDTATAGRFQELSYLIEDWEDANGSVEYLSNDDTELIIEDSFPSGFSDETPLEKENDDV